ncbi:cytochrome P450 [Streptomyces pseudoechinosporeus]
MTSTMPSAVIPTAPGALPGIGHAWQMFARPLAFTASLNALGPVVRMMAPGHPDVFMINSPELLHRILVTETRDYAKGRITEGIGSQFGVSLVMDVDFEGMSLFDSHRRHRRAVQPGFHPGRIAAQVHDARQGIEEHTARWQPGQTLLVNKDLACLAYTLNSRAFCGQGPATHLVADALAGLVSQTTRGLYWRMSAPRLGHLSHVPGTGAFNRALARLRTAITATIYARRATGQTTTPDVLSHLLDARYSDSDEALDDSQIVAELVFYLFAAVHSVGEALPYAFYELARHPDVERRMHDELDTVLAGGPVRAQDLPRLDYTRRVLQEVLRLHPPVWLVARRALIPVQLGDAHLPAGAEISFCPYALHRDPQVYAEPLRFDPDRWLPERAKNLPAASYLALGAGPRKCIGDNLAMMHMLTALATIGARWCLRPVPGHRLRPAVRIFLSSGPLPMTVEPRPAPQP